MFRDRAAEERAAALLQTQLAVMRFADEYTARINAQIVAFQQATTDPAERLESQSWLVSQATAAFTIASGPNPQLNAIDMLVLNAIDMLVFTTLSRMVIEDRWVGELYGKRAEPLLAEHRALEERIFGYATALLSAAQIEELRASIAAWHRENPLARAVPFIHLADFAVAASSTTAGTPSSGSIFSFLGIDPLSNLDPAVRELAQSRQLAERAVYYGQRAPKLVSMEAQRLAFELAVAPESVRLVNSVAQIGGAAQTAGNLAADLPALLAAERAAMIDQLAGILDAREGQLQALAVELRTALEAGGVTSDSVRETIAAFDALMVRFERPAPREGATPSRPFDVTEYTEALRELGATAAQLQLLLAQVDGTQVSDHAADRMATVVDRVYWRLVQLVMVLVAAVVIGALAYRAIARRS